MTATHESHTGSTLLVLLRDPTDADAWRTFVDRYGPKVYAWCQSRKLQEADAADVTGQVLLKLAVTMRSFVYEPSKGSFRNWLRKVTTGAVNDFCSARRCWAGSGDSRVHEFLDSLEAREDLEGRLAEEFDLELLEEARARVQLRVTRPTWTAFALCAVDGRPEQNVAADLGISIAAVYMAKSRVLKMLKEEIHRLERDGQA